MKSIFSLVCGVQPARVVYGDGEVLYLPPSTSVEEVLQSYPHHFVCQSNNAHQMLPLDAELQSGCIYFLLPVPRLFPAAPSQSPQCRCYVSGSEELADQAVVSPLRVYSSPQRFGGLGFRSPRWRKSKVQPESNPYSAGRVEAARPVWRNCPWRPRLGCISEEDDLELALEQLRYHGFMRKETDPAKPQSRMMADPPANKPPPPQLKPSKSARIVADAEIEWNSATAGVPTMIAIC